MIALDVLSWFCLVIGAVFAVIGAAGMLRMPDLYTRMHAASLIETLGGGLILIGLALQAGSALILAKLFIIGLLIFFTAPASTHALAKAALARNLKPLLADEADRAALDGEPSSKR